MPSHALPYPHGPPANVATLPAPINCTYSRSKWAVRSCRTRITVWTLFLPLPKFSDRAGTLGIDSILITNKQQFFMWIPQNITSKYSIPSVPSRLEGVKTRPDCFLFGLLRRKLRRKVAFLCLFHISRTCLRSYRWNENETLGNPFDIRSIQLLGLKKKTFLVFFAFLRANLS